MALDAEDLKAIGKLIATSQTSALAAAFKPVTERLDKIEKVEAPDVAALIAKALEDATKKKGDDKTGPSDADKATAAKLAALEAQLEAQKTATGEADTARKTEQMLSALRTRLASKKVPGARIDHVVALLHNAQGRIALSDAGEPTIRFDRESAGGAYQDHLNLDKGLDEFLATDAGKSFLPAVDVQGSKVHNNTRGPLTQTSGKPNVRALQTTILNHAVNS